MERKAAVAFGAAVNNNREMNNVLCGYNCQSAPACGTEGRCPNSFSRCMNGIMVLVGIISGLVFAAAVVLLFVNSLITAWFPAVLTALVTGVALLVTVVVLSILRGVTEKGMGCLRCKFGGLMFGIIGTILSAFIAVSADLTAVTVTAAVVLGIVSFFFAYMVVSLLFVALCGTEA